MRLYQPPGNHLTVEQMPSPEPLFPNFNKILDSVVLCPSSLFKPLPRARSFRFLQHQWLDLMKNIQTNPPMME